MIVETVVCDVLDVVGVLLAVDAFDLVIVLSCPFGICSLTLLFSDRHDELTVGGFSFSVV